jgi:hypothetical protein
MDEFDNVTIEHPGDRIANADDENGIFTDWSKEYEAESIVSDEIKVFPYQRRRETIIRQKRVTFEQEQKLEEFKRSGSRIKVHVELNPAVFLTQGKQNAINNVSSVRQSENGKCEKEEDESGTDERAKGEREKENKVTNCEDYWNEGFDDSSNSSDNVENDEEDAQFTVNMLTSKWSQM